MDQLKLTPQLAEDIRTRVKALSASQIEKLAKSKNDNGTFDVIISTEDLDRAGEIVRQDGWELTNYKNNPIVLWGHDYYSLPIGVCTETYKTNVHGVPATGAKGVFYPADINPFAQQVRRMYEYGVKSGVGVGCTTSVGFIPKEFDENNQRVITRAELLEFSFVPIPANQGVGPAQGRALSIAEARSLQLDIVGLHQKGMAFNETVGFIPKSITEEIADAKTAWTKPTLKDFTEKAWAELTDEEKLDIASHFAYRKDYLPASFEDLKLPYRRGSDGAVIFGALKTALRSVNGPRGGIDVEDDKKAVYEHLAKHYALFGKQAPEFKTLKEAQAGDQCTNDDGSPGLLASDPNDPDGPLVCIPQDQDKGFKDEHGSQKELLKAVSDEHDRHVEEMDKAVEKCFGTGEKSAGKFKELRDSIKDEHTMHRANSVANFKGFNPSDEKAFDRNPHLKALRDEHDTYEAKNFKALDEFEEKSVDDGDEDNASSALSDKLDSNQRSHKRAVNKIAKAMCKEAFGQEDEPDEKTIEVLKEFLAPYVDEKLLAPLTLKIATKLTTETTKKLSEAHQHLKAATTVLESLSKTLGDGSGEETPAAAPAPAIQRSNPVRVAPVKETELDAHLFARDLLRSITTAAGNGLKDINEEIRKSRSHK